MSSVINEIKGKLDIVEVVGSYIKLEKAGQNYKAKCPFHNEKTPSFFVSPGRNSFYCFGCGVKGDIFSFVEQFEGLDFMGSLKVLAERAGVKLRFDPKAKEKGDRTERLFELMDESTSIFEENLRENSEAVAYLRKRGLSDETIKEWRIGYAKDEWHDIEQKLKERGYSETEMLACGMIKKGDSGKQYDVFRARIMFPIFDGAKRVVAFSGRIFKQDESDVAKYLNSGETELFKKSEILYGFHRAKSGIRRLGFAILVEGQMDLLMCHQAGYDNAVATSGTALTFPHLSILKRLSSNLVLAYDNDNAGQRASLKAFQMALSSDFHVKALKITDGKDPADLILHDKDAWKKAVGNAKHITTIVFEDLMEQNLPQEKFVSRFRENVIPLLASLPSESERARFISEHKMAVQTGIREEYLMEEIHGWSEKNTLDSTSEPKENLGPPKVLVGDPARRLFAILFAVEGSSINGISNESLKKRLKEIVGEAFDNFYKQFNDERSRLIFEAENIYGGELKEKEIDELFLNLEEDILRQELEIKMKDLQKAEIEKNDDLVIKLLALCQKVTKRLSEIKNKINEEAKF